MEFNKNELKVLWNAFNSSDIDGDGVLSRNDLRITGGLESDEEVETLFNALKGAAGNTENSEVVTFEEFSLGVVDFPFLLEHFKKEYEELIENTQQNLSVNTLESGLIPSGGSIASSEFQILESYISPTWGGSKLYQFSFLSSAKSSIELNRSNISDKLLSLNHLLHSSLNYFGRAVKIPIGLNSSTLDSPISIKSDQNLEDLKPEVLLERLRNKSKLLFDKINEANQNKEISTQLHTLFVNILNGIKHLISGFSKAQQIMDQHTEEYSAQTENLVDSLDALRQKCEKLTQKNSQLSSQLYILENEQLTFQSERHSILSESQKLQSSLADALQAKTKADAVLECTLDKINEKEAIILQAQHEVRRLRNLKTLQEMTVTYVSPDRAKAVRNFRRQTPNRPLACHGRQISLVSARAVSPSYIELSQASQLERRTESLQKQFDELDRAIQDKEEYLSEMEQKEQTVEDLNRKLQQSNYENTDLLMQLQRQKFRNLELSKKLKNDWSPISSDDENILTEQFWINKPDVKQSYALRIPTINMEEEPTMETDFTPKDSSRTYETDFTIKSSSRYMDSSRYLITEEGEDELERLEKEIVELSSPKTRNRFCCGFIC